MNLPTEPLFVFQRQRQPGGLFSSLSAEAKATDDTPIFAPQWLRGLQTGKQGPRRPGINRSKPVPGASADSLAMMAQMLTGIGGNFLTRNSNKEDNFA